MAAELSVILPTATDFKSIRETVQALHAQTAVDRIELVIVVTSSDVLIPGLSDFAAVKVVNGGPLRTSNNLRVAGIRAATAPLVVMSEDHSFPDPQWAQAFIEAHRDNFAVVGPALRNANPRTMWSWASLFLEYGPWLEGAPKGEVAEVGGHNSCYKRDLLLAFGERLDDVFEQESVVQRELREQGYRILYEPAAITHHLNFSLIKPSIELRFNAGRSYAGHRTIGWNLMRRIGFALGSPLIPLVRFNRIVRLISGSARYSFLLPRILPQLIFSLFVDGFGEMVGYIAGPGKAPRFLAQIEFDRRRFMTAEDCAELDGRMIETDAGMSAAPLIV